MNVQINAQLKKVGTELCTIRKSLGFNLDHVAEIFKVDRRLISSIESGESKNLEVICLYCDKFGVDLKLNYEIL